MGLVWLSSNYLTFADINFPGQKYLAVLFGIGGCMLSLITMFTMIQEGTTVDPVSPDKASKLVTTGIFQWSRNPIYLALVLILISLIIWLGNWISLFWSITMIWYLSSFQIRAEERVLQDKFGEQYGSYKKKVRRWI
jgi:protein-S-isoprenylcysteine O-methyltransferase Ste14